MHHLLSIIDPLSKGANVGLMEVMSVFQSGGGLILIGWSRLLVVRPMDVGESLSNSLAYIYPYKKESSPYLNRRPIPLPASLSKGRRAKLSCEQLSHDPNLTLPFVLSFES